MMTERARHWTQHDEQKERFFSLSEQVIVREARFQAARYTLPNGSDQDVAARTRLKLIERMNRDPPRAPFDASTVEEAVERAVERFTIRELARQAARLDRRWRSRQALALDGLPEPTMRPDAQARIFECLEHAFQRMDEAGLTRREHEIFVRETARRIDMDQLDDRRFAELADLTGISVKAIRRHIATYDSTGRLCDSDRAAWSRATNKLGHLLTGLGLRTAEVVA
jgi:hypothetical protein